jgi:hypothetical protein
MKKWSGVVSDPKSGRDWPNVTLSTWLSGVEMAHVDVPVHTRMCFKDL